jgi:hypothetical protein
MLGPPTQRFHSPIKFVFDQNLIQPIIKRIARSADHVLGRDKQRLLLFSSLPHSHAQLDDQNITLVTCSRLLNLDYYHGLLVLLGHKIEWTAAGYVEARSMLERYDSTACR